MELIDPQRDDEDDDETNEEMEIEKWTDYIEKYTTQNNLSGENGGGGHELKEALLRRPVFLTRNAHYLKCKFGVYNNNNTNNINNQSVSETDLAKKEETSKEVGSSDDLQQVAAAAATDSKSTPPITTEQPSTSTAVVEGGKKDTFKIRYQANETTCMYRRNSFKNARKHHQPVTKRMYDRFRKYTNKWLKESSVSADCIDDWLLGYHLTGSSSKTICVKESWPKKPPYHVYYKYKAQLPSEQPLQATTGKKSNSKSANKMISTTTTTPTGVVATNSSEETQQQQQQQQAVSEQASQPARTSQSMVNLTQTSSTDSIQVVKANEMSKTE
jgi:hypothetical protein